GLVPWNVTVPHTPTNPCGQAVGAGAGSRPLLQPRAAARASASAPRRPVIMLLQSEKSRPAVNLTSDSAWNTLIAPCRSTSTAARSAKGASVSNRRSRSTLASGPPARNASRAQWSRCTRRSSRRRFGKASAPCSNVCWMRCAPHSTPRRRRGICATWRARCAERERPSTEAERSAERAWRDLQQAGGARPGMDLRDELLRGEMDRAAREAAAEEQLRELKKKMKKE